MNILVICQYYYPEPFRITDICEELVERGHYVTVVTGIPNYPMGEIYEGYRHGEKRDEIINGVNIHRCFTIGRKSGVLYRFLNYYSYAISSTRYVSKLKDDYDVVFVNQLSPVMMANAGIRYKKIYNKKLVLYCLDLWPESLVAGGMKTNSAAYKLFQKISKKIYLQADKILITSKSFADYFSAEFGINDTVYMPQYAESVFDPESCKKEPNEYVDLMFAGNIGATQDIDTIIKTARLTIDHSEIRWHIVGDGSELDNIKRSADGLQNVFFYGRRKLEEMPSFYAKADAMIVTMKSDAVLSRTLPGKVQTYLAAGKPIIGAINGAASEVIKESLCGYVVEAGDVSGLAEIALKMSQDRDFNRMSLNAVSYYREIFSKEEILHSILKYLQNNV